jgi:hypothetical protein
MTDPKEVRAWRDAHHNLEVPDTALATMAPFASLYAVDFITYLESKAVDPAAADFLRSLLRELVWAYDNWAKAQHDGDAPRLLQDMLNSAAGPGEADSHYGPIKRFITDYAAANGIVLKAPGAAQPVWADALLDGKAYDAPQA